MLDWDCRRVGISRLRVIGTDLFLEDDEGCMSEDFESALEYLWRTYTAQPRIMGMSLDNVRKMELKSPEVLRWLEDAKDMPGDSLVVLGLGDSVIIYAPEDADRVMEIMLGIQTREV